MINEMKICGLIHLLMNDINWKNMMNLLYFFAKEFRSTLHYLPFNNDDDVRKR